MSESFGHRSQTVGATVDRNISKIAGIGTLLIAVNIVLMLALSYTTVAELGLLAFSNFFIGIAVFAVTVGGGFWIASKGIERGSLPVAGAGVTLTQAGYGLIGSAILVMAPSALRLPALGITTVITGAITAGITYVVFTTNKSFEGWQQYAFYCFIGGIAVGAVGFFVNPVIMIGAGLLFFLGFVVDLTYEVWAVRESRYASDLRSAIGIYVAVMGVFIHVLQWVLRILSMLDQ